MNAGLVNGLPGLFIAPDQLAEDVGVSSGCFESEFVQAHELCFRVIAVLDDPRDQLVALRIAYLLHKRQDRTTMPKTQYTQEAYDLLLAVYRREGPKFTEASRTAKCSLKVARSAWQTGWRGLPWARPIEEVTREEQEAARARRLQLEREEIEKAEMVRRQAKQDAIEARAQEARAAKLSRANGMLFAASVTQMLKSLMLVSGEIDRWVNDPNILITLPPQELRKLVQTISAATREGQGIIKTALEIERIVTGQPIAVLGVQVSSMTPTQLSEEIIRMRNALAGYLPTTSDIQDAEYEAIEASPDPEE